MGNELRVDKYLSVEVKAVDEARKVLTFRGTTSTPDRVGDVMVPQGARFDNFRRNPIFLWAHDWKGIRLPIGKSLQERVSDEWVDFDIQFDETDPFAMQVFDKYRNKYLNAVSIGFRPLKWDFIGGTGSGDEYGPRARRFTEWELLELSGVPVPANPEALQAELAKLLGALPVAGAVLEAHEVVEIEAPKASGESGEALPDAEQKEGAVLSRKNRGLLASAMGSIKEVLDSAGDGEGSEKEPDKEPGKKPDEGDKKPGDKKPGKTLEDLGLTEEQAIALLRPKGLTAVDVAEMTSSALQARINYLAGRLPN